MSQVHYKTIELFGGPGDGLQVRIPEFAVAAMLVRDIETDCDYLAVHGDRGLLRPHRIIATYSVENLQGEFRSKDGVEFLYYVRS